MTYTEYKDARQQEFNKLPIFYAFDKKQMEEALAERGIKYEDAPKHIYRLSNTGGYYLKKDSEVVKAFFAKDADAELRAMMEADLDFARDAIEYEMFNHEYPINWQGDWDVASCFGNVEYDDCKYAEDYLKELGFTDKIMQVWNECRRKVQQAIEW